MEHTSFHCSDLSVRITALSLRTENPAWLERYVNASDLLRLRLSQIHQRRRDKPRRRQFKAKVKAQDDDVDTDLPTPKANGKAKTEFKTTIPEDATAGSAQYAKAERLVVPVDETCPFNGQVYIDSDGIIYDASLNQTNAGANANKVCC